MNGMITKYRKKDGRISWGYHYKAEGRQFSKSGFATKFEVSKGLGAALGRHQDAHGPARKGDTRTLAEYFDYWFDNHAALRCQPKTLERYRQLAKYLKRPLGHTSIRGLRAGAIQEAVNSLQLRGGVPTNAHPQGRPLAARTAHSTASHLFTCLGEARLEHVPANPMADRKVNFPKRPTPSPAVMDADAVFAILSGRSYSALAYDDAAGVYHFRAHNDGSYLDAELKVPDRGFEWGFKSGPAQIAFVMKLNDAGDWVETGDAIVGNTPAQRFFNMTVRKQK